MRLLYPENPIRTCTRSQTELGINYFVRNKSGIVCFFVVEFMCLGMVRKSASWDTQKVVPLFFSCTRLALDIVSQLLKATRNSITKIYAFRL